jgi:hypothetical protein
MPTRTEQAESSASKLLDLLREAERLRRLGKWEEAQQRVAASRQLVDEIEGLIAEAERELDHYAAAADDPRTAVVEDQHVQGVDDAAPRAVRADLDARLRGFEQGRLELFERYGFEGESRWIADRKG